MAQLSKPQEGGTSEPTRSWRVHEAEARLVVLAGEVGGRWAQEIRDFHNQLALGKVRHEPAILRRRVQLAWRMRWQAILSCSAAKAFAASLPELRGGLGAYGDTLPSFEEESIFQVL